MNLHSFISNDEVDLLNFVYLFAFYILTLGTGFFFLNIIILFKPEPMTRTINQVLIFLIYAAYLMLRAGIEDPDRRARFGAVYTILGFLSVPLTFFSARLFRTIHPVVIGTNQPGAEGSFDMTTKMLHTFLFALLTFTFIFADLLWHRIRLGRFADRVEQLKMKTMD